MQSVEKITLSEYIEFLKEIEVDLRSAQDILDKVMARAKTNERLYNFSLLLDNEDKWTKFNVYGFFHSHDLNCKANIIKNYREEREIQLAAITVNQGLVYLIGSDDARILKIGYTTRNIEERLREVQAGRAYELKVIKTKPGSFETEKAELLKARRFQIHSEWFTWDDSIIENF